MIATNHALTGALIGLTAHRPLLAIPAALLSHFLQDAMPHFDWPGNEAVRINRQRFVYQLCIDATLCFGIVLLLALRQPEHWWLAAVCAFAAASPDFMWIPKFLYTRRTGKQDPRSNWLWRFHSWIQWRTGPYLWPIEAAWFGIGLALLLHVN